MKLSHLLKLVWACGLLASPLWAEPADLVISVEVPQIRTSEYHRPYIGIWIERPDGTALTTLSVWYDLEMPNAGGEQWLKDLRQWWRKQGRSAQLPLDGVSSPTRPVGGHEVVKKGIDIPALVEGEYTLVVEAAREVGGRELLKLPFRWDGKTAVSVQAEGQAELGKIQFSATVSN